MAEVVTTPVTNNKSNAEAVSVLVLHSLAEQEAIIERNLSGFVEVGNALMRIRDEELYREAGFGGFVEYLESKPWGMAERSAYQQINAARVCAIAQTTMPEGQARELAPLLKKATPEVVRQVYAEVVEETAGRPTAKKIRGKVHEFLASTNGGKRKKQRRRKKVADDLAFHLSEIVKLIPQWEPGFADLLSGSECRKQAQLAEKAAEWLAEEYGPTHAGRGTPLAKIPT